MAKFRKRISIAPGVKLNLSKSGVSTTVGAKGASVNVGKKGTYLNTGVPGTGIYDRTRLGSNGAAGRSTGAGENKGASADTGDVSFAMNINDIEESSDIPPCPQHKPVVHIVLLVLFFWTFGIANLIYFLRVKGKQKEWQTRVDNYKTLAEKIRAVKEDGRFADAKVFIIDLNNILVLSEKGQIAMWIEKQPGMKVLDVKSIQKMTQEIETGACYANFYTDDFSQSVVPFFLGNAYGKEEKDTKRKLYNEIKGLFTILKKSSKEKPKETT